MLTIRHINTSGARAVVPALLSTALDPVLLTPEERVPQPDASSEGPPPRRGPLARVARSPWTFQIAFAAVLLALAAWRIDTRDLLHAFRDARYGWLTAALAVYFMARMVHTVEWQITLVKVGRAPFGGLFGATLIGTLVNAVIPAAAGDVAKMQIVANRYGLSRVGLITSRGAESVVNAFVMVLFIALGFVLHAAGVASGGVLLLMALGSGTAFAAAAVASRFIPEQFPDWPALSWLPARVQRTLRARWPRFHEGLELVRNPMLLSVAFVLNIVGWAADIAIIWAYGRTFHLDVPIGAYVSITVAVAIITVFPLTPGNLGTYEVILLGVLKAYQVPTEQAIAFAVGMHLISTAFNIGLGLVAMVLMGVRPGELLRLRSNAPTDTDPPPIVSVD